MDVVSAWYTYIPIIELVDYARTLPFSLEPLIRLKPTEWETSVELEGEGVNYYKRHNPIIEAMESTSTSVMLET
jgi:hypothetical protein